MGIKNNNSTANAVPCKPGAWIRMRKKILCALLLLTLPMAAYCQIDPTNPTNDSGGGSYTNYIPDYTPNIVYPTNTTLEWSLALSLQPVYANLVLSPNGILYVPYYEGRGLMALNVNSFATNFVLFDTNYFQNGYASPVLGTDGSVYTSQASAINPTNGNIIWTTYYSGISGSTIALGLDGSIYVTSQSFAYALTNAYGITNVCFSTNSYFSYSTGIGTNIYSYALTNVGLKWAKSTEDYIQQNTNFVGLDLTYSQPAIGLNGTVYINSGEGQLFAVNPTNGNSEWVTTNLSSSEPGAPAIGPDGTIYFGTSYHFCAVNPANGNFRWIFQGHSTSPLDAFGTPAAIGSDGTIYVATDGGGGTNHLFAFESTTNVPLWTANLGVFTIGSVNPSVRGGAIALAADGEIYVTDIDAAGTLYSFSPNGTTNWTYQTEGDGLSGPIIGPDGSIYVEGYGDSPGVYAFQGVSPVTCGAWPEWRRNARATAAVAQATLSSPVVVSNGFQFQITGFSNSPVCACETSDFHFWTNGGQIVLTNGVGTFVDTGTSNYLYRFYRAYPQ